MNLQKTYMAGAALAGIIGLGASAQAATAYCVRNIPGSTNLVRFDTNAPGTILSSVPVTGLDSIILGMDYRPAAS